MFLSHHQENPMTAQKTFVAAVATLVLAAGAGAATADDPATDVKVTGAQTLAAGDTSPFDAAGVKAIRRGKAIPAGYELIGRRVDISRGRYYAGAALRFACPGEMRLRTFGVTGDAGFQSTRDYVGRKVTWVMSGPAPSKTTASGVVYAVCR
jgi:hypothetical protein